LTQKTGIVEARYGSITVCSITVKLQLRCFWAIAMTITLLQIRINYSYILLLALQLQLPSYIVMNF